jgi:hypothetical protein
MNNIERNVERKSEKKTGRFEFASIKPGDSIWYADRSGVEALRRAFKAWKAETGAPMKIASEEVDEDDPKGAGYRVFFEAEAIELRPIVLAKLPRFEMLDEIMEVRMRYTGIQNGDDIIAAALSAIPSPKTIAEATLLRKMIFTGKTPWQIERMAEMGHASFEEHQQRSLQRDRDQERAHDWPADDGRDVSPAYSELTAEQRRELRAEAMIVDEDEYLKAMRSRPIGEPAERSFGAVIGGYSDFTTWKVRQRARMGIGSEE